MLFDQRPVEPRHLVVLAIGVVVAALGAPAFVPHQQHRHALAQQERRQHILDLTQADRLDRNIAGRPFDPVIAAAVVVFAVPVGLAVGLVVLAVVADKIVERKPVVGRDEVDAVVGTAPAGLVQVARPGQPGRQRPFGCVVAQPVAADIVPVSSVEFRPARAGEFHRQQVGERADLVGPGGIPGLRYDLGIGQQRVGGHLGVDAGARERHAAEGALPRRVAVGVVQQHEASVADLLLVGVDVGGDGGGERGDALGGRDLLDGQLGAPDHAEERGCCLVEQV